MNCHEMGNAEISSRVPVNQPIGSGGMRQRGGPVAVHLSMQQHTSGADAFSPYVSAISSHQPGLPLVRLTCPPAHHPAARHGFDTTVEHILVFY